MAIARLTPQTVTGILKAAGLKGAINTRRQRRSGYHVTKRTPFVVGVTFYDWEDTGDQWGDILAALAASSLTIAHGFGPDMVKGEEALQLARKCGACLVVSEK